jgi:hypothetical protein
MNSDPENRILDNASSDEIAIEKISWDKAADAYCTLLKFVNCWPCYSAQEVMQLHFAFYFFCKNEKNAPSKQTFARCSSKPVSPTRISIIIQRKGSNEGG